MLLGATRKRQRCAGICDRIHAHFLSLQWRVCDAAILDPIRAHWRLAGNDDDFSAAGTRGRRARRRCRAPGWRWSRWRTAGAGPEEPAVFSEGHDRATDLSD